MATTSEDPVNFIELWSCFEPVGVPQAFRRHSLIYTETQPAHTLYLLRSGQVSLQLNSTNGRSMVIQVIEPGQLFGHSVLAGDKNYDTVAESLKPVQVLAVPRDNVFAALRERPALATALVDALGQYQRVVGRRLDEVAFKSVPARLASVLLDLAEASGEQNAAETSRVPRRTHQQLAEMINAYRETVTKVINQFREARLLDIDRSGITLLNTNRLRELAQS
jgi:CRP-like cAMP-binding protein